MPRLSMIRLQYLQLDQHILLRSHTLSLTTIMIRTNLPIQDGINIVPLPKQYLPLLPQHIKLPSDKCIIIPIHGCSNKRPPPINSTSKPLHMLHPNGRKVLQPMNRIGKLRNLLLRNHSFQNVPLTNNASPRLLDEFGLAPLGFGAGGCGFFGLGFGGGGEISFHLGADGGVLLGEFGWDAVLGDFGLEFVGGRLNRHPRAMKRKRKQRVLPPISLKLRPKHSLGQTKRMSQMQMTITIRVRKRNDEFILGSPVLFVGGVGFKCLFAFPESLDGNLGGDEGIAFGGSFWGAVQVERAHFSGWCCWSCCHLECAVCLRLGAE
mmetsp:Transcript_17556/g.37962  ORF Transcript_17556/g.37962 Transcript_17556/m.37962 type:complete len:321 (-) Transcript_17556:54-1016(-)